MPTAIPQSPPPPQSKEAHPPKATVRGKKEDLFREVLDGAKKQVKPKQREPKAPEPAAEKEAEAPAVDHETSVDAEAEAGTEEVVDERPAPRRKEKSRKSEGSDVEEPVQMGEAAVVTAAVPFEVAVDFTIVNDAGVAAEAGVETDSAPPSDLATTDEQLLAGLSNVFVRTMETPGAAADPADAQAPGLGLQSSPITEASPETTDTVSPASPGAAVPAGVVSVSIPPETVIEEAEDLPVATPRMDVRLPEEAVDGGESIAPEDLPVVARDVSLPGEQSAGDEQTGGDPSGGEPSQEQAVTLATSFSALVAENDPTQAADATTLAPPVKPDQPAVTKVVLPTAAPVADPLEARFAEANHPRIVTAVQAELMPGGGGSVRLRLDPPELGALQVRIEVKDGVLAASFQTSNDEATRLLSRSLQQLKNTLESHGVTVEKLHVQQTPREQWDGGRNGDERQQQSPQHWQQQEQQRREMLQRMWRRVRDGRDPFDLVA